MSIVSTRMKTRIIEDVSALGALPFFAAVVIGLWLLKLPLLAAQVLAGVILAYGVTYCIRAVYHKERPRPQAHTTHLERIDASSFPSMHSMRAAILCVLGILYIQSLEAGVALCCYAISVMASR